MGLQARAFFADRFDQKPVAKATSFEAKLSGA